MLLVIWVVRRMDQVDGEPRSIRPTPQLLAFGIWLLYCVIRSNLDVVSRIWSPDLPIRPAWPAFLDIALLYALVNFVNTVAVMRFFECYGSGGESGRQREV